MAVLKFVKKKHTLAVHRFLRPALALSSPVNETAAPPSTGTFQMASGGSVEK